MRMINRAFPALAALSLAIPAALGWLLTGTGAGAATGLLWGGLVRIFFLHHVTWSINSICHFYGRRRFEPTTTPPTSRGWLRYRWARPGTTTTTPSHVRPATGCGGGELDVSALVIRTLQRLGLAWNVVRIAPQRQEAKLDAG